MVGLPWPGYDVRIVRQHQQLLADGRQQLMQIAIGKIEATDSTLETARLHQTRPTAHHHATGTRRAQSSAREWPALPIPAPQP